MPGCDALWIREAEVVSMMDIGEAISALERGLLAEAKGDALNMIKTHAEWSGSTLHAIGAVFPKQGICGTKTWTHTPNGATPLLILFDANNGNLLAMIEAFALGQMRTAAASGVATRWLAAADAATFAMIGTGMQALTQVAAVLAVRPIREVRVFSPNEVHREQFADKLRSHFPVEVVACNSVRDATEKAAVITIATRATDPILAANMVPSGSHINSVGAIVPGRAEVAQDALARCSQIVTDSVPQAQKLSREMIEFFARGSADWNAVKSLASIVASRFTRGPADDVTLFKALGVGISDLSLGVGLYRQALASGRGTSVKAAERVPPRLTAKPDFARA